MKQYPCGSYARYTLGGCRCDPCRAANRAYGRRQRGWMGEFPRTAPPLVDAGPARRHVLSLMARGMGYKRIAALAGVPPSGVGAILWGRRDRAARRIRRETARKLLAVPYRADGRMLVPSEEGRLIVSELLARGWTRRAIGQRIHGPQAESLQAIRSERIEAATLRTLRTLMSEAVPARRRRLLSDARHPRTVRQQTPGMYDQAVPSGKLHCQVCSRPLAIHLMTERCA